MIAVGRLRDPQGLARPRRPGGDGRRRRRRGRGRALLRPAHALGQADERADDLGRPLRLVHRPQRLPLHRPPPLGRALAAHPGPRSARALASPTRAPTAASSTTTPDARMGLHRDADEKDFSWPVLSIASATAFRMGGCPPPDLPSSSKAATSSSSAARPASPTTASTASAPAPRACCPRAAGSTSPAGWSTRPTPVPSAPGSGRAASCHRRRPRRRRTASGLSRWPEGWRVTRPRHRSPSGLALLHAARPCRSHHLRAVDRGRHPVTAGGDMPSTPRLAARTDEAVQAISQPSASRRCRRRMGVGSIRMPAGSLGHRVPLFRADVCKPRGRGPYLPSRAAQ